jgi:hypothetical protein
LRRYAEAFQPSDTSAAVMTIEFCGGLWKRQEHDRRRIGGCHARGRGKPLPFVACKREHGIRLRQGTGNNEQSPGLAQHDCHCNQHQPEGQRTRPPSDDHAAAMIAAVGRRAVSTTAEMKRRLPNLEDRAHLFARVEPLNLTRAGVYASDPAWHRGCCFVAAVGIFTNGGICTKLHLGVTRRVRFPSGPTQLEPSGRTL